MNDENFEKAEMYKNLIIEQYPESDYAKLLLDPEYYKEIEARRNLAQTLYDETYEHYEAERYYTVYSNSTRALAEFEDPPEILAKEGVKIMVCRGLGRRAISLFNQLGIDVFIGANGTVREAIQAFNDGTLKKAGTTDACEQHAFRDHHHRETHT